MNPPASWLIAAKVAVFKRVEALRCGAGKITPSELLPKYLCHRRVVNIQQPSHFPQARCSSRSRASRSPDRRSSRFPLRSWPHPDGPTPLAESKMISGS